MLRGANENLEKSGNGLHCRGRGRIVGDVWLQAPRGGGATPSSEDEKTLYTLGMLLGRNLGTFNLTAAELELVKSGLTDMVLKNEHKVDLDKYGPKVDALARKRGQERVAVEKAQAKTFLDQAGQEAGAVVTPSGMVFRTVTPGTGATPTPTDRVSVQYEGRLTDGTVFDSTKKRGGVPATFPLNGVIKCWTEGVGRMKVGEKAVLTCPSAIAYGDGGRPPTIPGGATLIFDVELVSIAPPNAGAPHGDVDARWRSCRAAPPSRGCRSSCTWAVRAARRS